MTMPFYVAPEQIVKDRAEFARKGIARGRSLVAISCREAILICAENPSRLLRKVSEIYDRIAFGGVGKYNEFDQLRIAGVRHADLKGFTFSREDVDGRGLANAYAQILGNVFTHEMKPLEVEILVAEVGADPDADRMFHIQYDGMLSDEAGYSVIGGDADTIRGRVAEMLDGVPTVAEGIALAVRALATPDRVLGVTDLEVAVLDRVATRRAFRRIEGEALAALLPVPTEEEGEEAPPAGATPAGEETAPDETAGEETSAEETAGEESAGEESAGDGSAGDPPGESGRG